MISSLYLSVIGALLVPTLAQTTPPPLNCSTHEVYDPNCFLDCLPEPSCIEPFPQPPSHPCHYTCGKCLCAPGYIRFGPEGTRCVPHAGCPKYCSYPHKEYLRCGTDCGRECPSRGRFCFTFCEEGCYCKKPYLLDEKSDRCVLPEYCPK